MTDFEYHLRVFADRSELWQTDGTADVYLEGSMSTEAKRRYKKIQDEFSAGFLPKLIAEARDHPDKFSFDSIDDVTREELEAVALSMSSEKGRALVHILILQLAIKCVVPEQSIRLHKANSQAGKFGWVEGVSMRTLDAAYVTPALRESNLSKVNKDGAFMTRTFAENYPFSTVYKAGILGARQQWLSVVDKIEGSQIDPTEAIALVLFKLINLADNFELLASETVNLAENFVNGKVENSFDRSFALLQDHFESSDYSARLMEIVMHSLMQALDELHGLAGLKLKPLTQMRNANLKHSNFGDVELTSDGEIVSAWDAKYGKANMREELEELDEKFSANSPPGSFGYVTSVPPEMSAEIVRRANEISHNHVVDIEIVQLGTWLKAQFAAAIEIGIDESQLASHWVTAYTGSLAQRRREYAPIDEPCHEWLAELKAKLIVFLER